MKVAFIEPFAHLHDYSTDYHMILPNLPSRDYYDFYKQVEGHKILDNGAAEGSQVHFEELIALGWELGVDEIVVPDVMGDFRKTCDLATQFEQFLKKNPFPPGFEPGFIGVAHGKTLSEILTCINNFAYNTYIDVLALPRILTVTMDDPFIRYNLMRGKIFEERINPYFEAVHALGSSQFPKEAILLMDTPMRGIDTSFPGVMSMAQKNISFDAYISRQSDYFTGVYLDEFIADRNHEHYLEWCNYEYGESKERS